MGDTLKKGEYQKILENPITFTAAFKTLKDTGNLVYEYNPFRNYRLSQTMFEYNNGLYSYSDLYTNFNIFLTQVIQQDDGTSEKVPITENNIDDVFNKSTSKLVWCRGDQQLPIDNNEAPILRRKGELVNFETNELKFDINHPVTLTPQYSYDNSVNLIINDGKNQPRLINSRFSATDRNKYQIVDRRGDNDTNIYDQGIEFDVDTSLHKKTKTIPQLTYGGTFSSGNLSIGNYHFYFKYLDADGNESDFFAESGLVSVFIGNTPYNMHTGSRNENSRKGVSFLLRGLDSGYQYLSVYYTRSTAEEYENATTAAYKINQKYLINSSNISSIKVTGFEEVTEIPLTDINLQYQIFNSVQTQTMCQNRLFFGNVSTQNINYKELLDISLRFLPCYSTQSYDISNIVSEEYDIKPGFNNSYYNSKFIYDKVGYWPGELYRFGIVYILNDGTLTPVFNVRGIKDIPEASMIRDRLGKYSEFDFIDNDKNRTYITYNEETNIILSNEGKASTDLENCKGVISFPESSSNDIYGIQFKLPSEQKNDIIKKLQELNVRGYFFVRQKRIPTILCQAFIIGIDKISHTPVIPFKDNENDGYIAECFLESESRKLSHEYDNRTYTINRNLVDKGAICPDYDVDVPYYNTLFSGDNFVISKLRDINLKREEWNHRFYYEDPKDIGEPTSELPSLTVKIQSVEDNQKLAAIDNTMFSARAGEAEEVFRFEYVAVEDKTTEASNLLRGSFGPFLGLENCLYEKCLVNIHIPNYTSSNLEEYFLIRYNDKSSYYAIGDRKFLEDYNEDDIYYRGDSYICQFTHRINRNFQDSTSPTNDKIVDEKCWVDNWKMDNGVMVKENIDKINLGDVNAVQLGQWVTFVVRSNNNLNIRTLDASHVDETALFGQCRGFFPYYPASTRGVYKIPEALCYNKGFQKTVSERWNFEVPEVPTLKNDFTNRISYSNITVTDAFQNGVRTFLSTNYRDYPKTYGSITKIIELRGSLLCVFEHGICLIAVNERTVAGEGSGGTVYINTSNVLPENPKVISDTFGSQWKDSIIKTPRGVYGVDTVGKKIWRTNGEEIDFISDFKVQEFLNQNISLTERELVPVIGVRNVKTHYNKHKGDVMFTFYDNLYGFEEKVWNLCYNEDLQRWITFYSWVPSYSENIYNQFFSFDRNTSKWITKLGISTYNNYFSDGVTLDSVIIGDDNWAPKLHLSNRNLPTGTGVKSTIEYELVRDNYKNYELFEIVTRRGDKEDETIYSLKLKDGIGLNSLNSEIYAREITINNITYILDKPVSEDTTAPAKRLPGRQTLPKGYKYIKDGKEDIYPEPPTDPETKYTIVQTQKEFYSTDLKVYKNERGIRVYLDRENQINPDKIVRLLNIRAKIKVSYNNSNGNTTLGEAYTSGYNNKTFIDQGYYDSVVAVIPKYNMQFLTTDFWKHGQAGIIDIADEIAPTHWYGKQHPFEFEFVVADNPQSHKIFDNLQIISNKAAPESFHYEIVGECYEFAKDKKNMYIRQEATKELYQFNGSDIVYNPDYKTLNSEPRPLKNSTAKKYDKSTIFPLYYSRQDTINEIEDFYHLYGHDSQGNPLSTKNFSALAGAEIVRYPNLDEYRIWNHAKAVDIHDFQKGGRMRGNMQYKEDKWDVQINPLNLVQRNESQSEWTNIYGDGTKKMVPAEYNLFTLPDELYKKDEKGEYILDENGNKILKPIALPSEWKRNIISWGVSDKINKEVKLKDKFIKIRVRYSGKDLAVISALKTLYSISYA